MASDDLSGALARVLRAVLDEMGIDAGDERVRLVQRELERASTIALLRELCGEFGDNDWPDGLHLYDVIEKHLARHLREAARSAGIAVPR